MKFIHWIKTVLFCLVFCTVNLSAIAASLSNNIDKSATLNIEQKVVDWLHNKKLATQSTVDYQFKKLNPRTKDKANLHHFRVKQSYQGLPILGPQYVLHLTATGVLKSESGKFHLIDYLNTTPIISEEEASNIILDKLRRANKQSINANIGVIDRQLVIYPQLQKQKTIYQLVWQISAATKDSNKNYIVSATDGSVLNQFDNLDSHESDSSHRQAAGDGHYSGAVNFYTQNTCDGANGSNCYAMKDTSHAYQSYQVETTDSGDSYIPYQDDDNQWIDTTQTQAVELSVNMQRAYDYFKDTFAREGFDNQNSLVTATIDPALANNAYAYADKDQLTFGVGDGYDYGPFMALEIVAHEFCHLVTRNDIFHETIYGMDARAISESLSDSCATLIESFYAGSAMDWLIGEDIKLDGTPDRNMYDPESTYQPEHLADYKINEANEPEPYKNMGFVGFVFSHLIDGTEAINNTSLIETPTLGLETTRTLYYYAISNGYLENINLYDGDYTAFYELRAGLLAATEALYGQATEYTAVDQAFDAVGITDDATFWLKPYADGETWGPYLAIMAPGGSASIRVTLESINDFSGTVTLTPTISPDFPGTVELSTSSVELVAGDLIELEVTLVANNSSINAGYSLSILAEALNGEQKFNLHDLPLAITTSDIGLNINPWQGTAGDTIQITGINLSQASCIAFSGAENTIDVCDFISQSDQQIELVLPAADITDGQVFTKDNSAYLSTISNGYTGEFPHFDYVGTGNILDVGEGYPYATITEALNAAQDNDEIHVHPGIYKEHAWIDDIQGLTIKGMSEEGEVILQQNPDNLWPILDLSQVRNFIIEGFICEGNFTEINSTGFCIKAADSYGRVTSNIFRNITSTSCDSMVFIYDSALNWSELDHNRFENIDMDSCNAMIGVNDTAMHHNLFKNISTTKNGLFTGSDTNVEIYNNLFIQNNLYALLMAANSDISYEIMFSNNTLFDNSISYNLIYLTNFDTKNLVYIENNIFDKIESTDGLLNIAKCDTLSSISNNISYTNTGKNYLDKSCNGVSLGNSDEDPRFIDETNLDLHLQPHSPAVDTGNTDLVEMGISTDYDDEKRDEFLDIGAYEHIAEDKNLVLNAQADEGFYYWETAYAEASVTTESDNNIFSLADGHLIQDISLADYTEAINDGNTTLVVDAMVKSQDATADAGHPYLYVNLLDVEGKILDYFMVYAVKSDEWEKISNSKTVPVGTVAMSIDMDLSSKNGAKTFTYGMFDDINATFITTTGLTLESGGVRIPD